MASSQADLSAHIARRNAGEAAVTRHAVAEIDGYHYTDAARFEREVVKRCRPLILRGLVRHWPSVRMGECSPQALKEYLLPLAAAGEVEVFCGLAAIAGKYYYNEDLRGFNFERKRMQLSAALEELVPGLPRMEAESRYVGSVPTDQFLPGFAAANPMPLLGSDASPRIWLGHAANVSCHHDTFDNLACVVAGTRRFTLYAPELIGRLYVGPIDNTISGPPVSLAAAAEDDERFPLFREIRDQALTAELYPGDALYLPKLWWHQVESTGPLSALVNYWWDAFSSGPDAPYTSMLLAMITIAERPLPERQAWKAFFDHYVFRSNGTPTAHLPADQHGVLGPLQPRNYGRIRARVMQLLRGR